MTFDKEFVVAHYNEDLSIWETKQKDPKSNVLIYSKNENVKEGHLKLENIGREAHTYFSHILIAYDDLADLTIFTQARVSDCSCPKDFFDLVDEIQPPYRAFYEINEQERKMESDCKGRPCHGENNFPIDIEYVFNELFVVPCPHNFPSAGCSLIAVTREQIVRLPLSWYERCLCLSRRKTAPWEFERLWPSIFNRDLRDYKI